MTAADTNPLLPDRDVDFLLYEVHDAAGLCALPAFSIHDRATFELTTQSFRRVSREVLFPALRETDATPPALRDGAVALHPRMHRMFAALAEAGVLAATRPVDVGGQQLPALVSNAAGAYLCAGNASAAGLAMLTTEAAHLLESFGSEQLRARYMHDLYAGRATGTMCLTEPHAGSSLGDITTKAVPHGDGSHRITGSKIFISGGEHDLGVNIVHMVLARIEGAPDGSRGVSLFCVPKLRPDGDALVDNDVRCAGVLHKIGWRALPSVVLNLGESGDCHGWLVGAPGRGLPQMFQMMNAARIGVGLSAAAVAYAAYQESLLYARSRPQGRSLTGRDAQGPQVLITDHPDVRRMLLRQKSIVEGALSLVLCAARYADVSEHTTDAAEKRRARLVLDLLTPVAKTFPAEKGFEANALAVQILGGYGYTSEYLPELWMREQKLNSIHEGTTGIQGLDLLGRKVVAGGGEALSVWSDDVRAAIAKAHEAGVNPAWCAALDAAVNDVATLTMELGARGLSGDVTGMLGHSADYMDLFSTVCVAWQWMLQAAAAKRGLDAAPGDGFYQAKLRAAQYWFATELPRVDHLAKLCRDGEDSYLTLDADWL
ncbi:MAG: acyl-CoA dehydrogenase [Polyangiales bacterium]